MYFQVYLRCQISLKPAAEASEMQQAGEQMEIHDFSTVW
jgi:hypothetical protein